MTPETRTIESNQSFEIGPQTLRVIKSFEVTIERTKDGVRLRADELGMLVGGFGYTEEESLYDLMTAVVQQNDLKALEGTPMADHVAIEMEEDI